MRYGKLMFSTLTALAVGTSFTAIAASAAPQDATLPAIAQANTTPAGGSPLSANGYIQHAAIGDLFEINSSQLALQRSGNLEVRQFAQMMIKDHEQSTTLIKEKLREEKAPILPPKTMDSQHMAVLESLKSEPANGFDQAYMKAQMDAHQEALKLHQDFAQNGSDPILRTAAKEIAGTVQTHLNELTKLQGKVASE